ncbi:MAG: TetR/AcrR family transcriptional regulator [Bacteriovoracaceae bacterium]|nr:TetR/AcrR family transcriptional regulator [Bacteriovoracaceae bacterium]
MTKVRLKATERREQILEIASGLFAERGFHGVTTRELASRLKITEPILYRHFSSKEDLWLEVKRSHRFPFNEWERYVNSATPSTSHFLFITGMLVWGITLGRRPGSLDSVERHSQILRLIGHGLFENEGPLRGHQEHFAHTLLPWWMMSFQAACSSGDLLVSDVSDETLWLAFSQMLSLALTEAGTPNVLVSWESERERLTHITRFILRGIGVKNDVILRGFSFAKMYQGFVEREPKNWTPSNLSSEL